MTPGRNAEIEKRPIAAGTQPLPNSRLSEETCIGRRAIVAIVAAISILDWPSRQFLSIDVVEQGNQDRVESPPHDFHLATPRRANAANFAEMKFDRRSGSTRRRPLVFRLAISARG